MKSHTEYLPKIRSNSTLPMSIDYFNFAKDQLKSGNYSTNYHPYHIMSQNGIDPNNYRNLLQTRNELAYNKFTGTHPFLNSYKLKQTNYGPINEVREAQQVEFPDETYVPLKDVRNFVNKSQQLYFQQKKRLEQINPELKAEYGPDGIINERAKLNKPKYVYAVDFNKLKQKNKKKWQVVRCATVLLKLFFTIKKLGNGKLHMRRKKPLLISAAKENFTNIREFILPCFSNIQKFCIEFFKRTIIYQTDDPEIQKTSEFVVKSFITQFFSDLSSAFTFETDIPERIKSIFKLYITNGSIMPPGFLTTFEFNRLEFNSNGFLTNMTRERQAMMVCFVLLYRVVLIDIFKRHLIHFPLLREMTVDERILIARFDKMLKEIEEKRKKIEKIRKGQFLRRGFLADREKEIKKINDEKILDEEDFELDKEKDYNQNKYLEEDNGSPVTKSYNNSEGGSNANPPKKRDKKRESESESSKSSDSEQNKKLNAKKAKRSKSKRTETKKTKAGNTINKKNKEGGIKTIKETNNEDEGTEKYGYYGMKKDDVNEEGKRKKGIYFKDKRQNLVKKDKEREKFKEEDIGYRGNKDEDERRAKRIKLYNKKKGEIDPDSNSNSDSRSSSVSDSSSETEPKKKKKKEEKEKKEKKPEKEPEEEDEGGFMKKMNDQFWGPEVDKDLNDKKNKIRSRELEIEAARQKVKSLPHAVRERIYEEEVAKVQLKVKHNFHFITNVMHYIFKGAIFDNVPIYREFFKENYLYSSIVFQKEGKKYDKTDEMELTKGILFDTKQTDKFISDNVRWLQTYKLLAFQFCYDFAQKVLTKKNY